MLVRAFIRNCFVGILTVSLVGACDIVIDDDNGSNGWDFDYGQNDSLDRAYEIEIDTLYASGLRTNEDVQFFSFTTAHGADTFDEVRVSVTVPGSELVIRMELLNEDGGRRDVTGASTAGQNLTYSFTPAGGTFYLRFSGRDPYGNDHRSHGLYSFKVENMNANDPYGPNHTLPTAHEIELGVEYNGVIVSTAEADYYRFTTEHGPDTFDNIEIRITDPGEDLITRLQIFSEDGASLVSHGVSTAGQRLTYTLTCPGGTYYLRISGRDPYGNDHRSSGRYDMVVENMNVNDPYGPNHTIGTAYEIELGQDYDAVLVSRHEADYFKFTTAHGADTFDDVQIRVTNTAEDLVIRLQLFTEDGSSVATGGASTAGQEVTYTLTGRGGTFYVRFSGRDQYGNDHRTNGEYTFIVENMNANDAYGPNHDLDSAHEIALDVQYDGVIVSQYEADYYKLSGLDLAKSYEIAITVPSESELIVRVQVFTPDGQSIGTEGASTPGQNLNGDLNNLSETVYFRFSGRDQYGNDHRTRGSYSFLVTEKL